MKSVYSYGQVQRVLVDDILTPTKEVLGAEKIGFRDIRKLIQVYNDFKNIPEPTKETCPDLGSHILLDIRDDFFTHLNIGGIYHRMFRRIINFVIGKRAYDNFYKDLMDWWFGEMLRRGWEFPGHNRPSSVLWHTIPPETRKRLEQSIANSYQILQDRLGVIQEKFGDSEEGKIHKQSRYSQFANRILTDVEREVKAWE